jgi:hypothetical protein
MKRFLFVLAIVLTGTICSIFTYFIASRQIKKNSVQNLTETTGTGQTADISGMLLYGDDFLDSSFTIKYPSSWFVYRIPDLGVGAEKSVTVQNVKYNEVIKFQAQKEDWCGREDCAGVYTPHYDAMTLSIRDNKNLLSLEDILKEIQTNTPSAQSLKYEYDIVGEQRALKTWADCDDLGCKTPSWTIIYKGKIYEFQYCPTDFEKNDIFDAIRNSITFK